MLPQYGSFRICCAITTPMSSASTRSHTYMQGKNFKPLRCTHQDTCFCLPDLYNRMEYNFLVFRQQDSRLLYFSRSTSPPHLCHFWSRTFQATGIGPLIKHTTNMWTTRNKVHYQYSWPHEQNGLVNNAMLTKIIAIYDPIKKRINSAMSSMSVCKINKGSCKVGSRPFIWTPPPKIDCPQTDDVGTHDLWLHYHEKTLYRIEVPYLHVSVHTQITCRAKTIQCYGTKTICEPSGLLLIPSNCTEIKALAHHNVLSSLMKNYTTQHSQQTIVSRFVTETSDTTAEKLRNLTSDIHFVECQLQSLLTTLFSVMAKQYPGETLSSLTDRKRAAITVGDVLTEIHCQPVQGIVLHSLVYNNTFSSRPLVEFLVNDTRKVGQIWSDGFLYEGIRFREQ